MKKKFNFKNLIGKKNLFLTAVALILVIILSVGVTYSWIEQISNVEMTLGGEKSPMHISTDRLNKPAETEINNGTAKTIDLSKYFYESGNMHLSSCYSDSKTFYFPQKAHMGSTDIPNFRLGTKDDANVNYISVSFKLKNTEDYEQAYWFDKSSNFFQTKSNSDSDLNKLIRMSMTVDGATSIFSESDTPTYKTVSGITASSATSNDCQSFKAYQYDSSLNDQSDAGNNNYSSTRGANGNTLFVLPAKTTSTITIKVWLEYDGNNSTASLADVNLKLVSSFTKTRKIYLVDNSLYGVNWITGDSATLWLALDNVSSYTYSNDDNCTNDTYWPITYKDTVNGKKRYEATIPAYYNNKEVYFLRCSNNGFGTGDTSKSEQKFKTIGSTNYWAWNWWKTTLPDTYDDRTFKEYTPEFGTWNSSAHHFYFIDSWGYYYNNNNDYSTGLGYAYLWDNNTVANGVKTVSNGAWPGKAMYYASLLSVGAVNNGNIAGHRVFAVFYDATFTHVIFNNNNNYQTSDIEIPSDIDSYDYFYDLNSNTWYKDTNQVPTSATSVTLHGSWDWNYDRTMYSKDNNVMYAAMYIDSNVSEFMVKNTYGGTKYYKHNGNGDNFSQTATWTLKQDGGTLGLNKSISGIYWFKWKENTKELTVTYPFSASGSSSGGGSGGSSSDETTEITTTQPTEEGIYLYGSLNNTGSYIQFAKFSSADVNGYVDLNLTKNGTYTIFIWKRQGTTNYQMGQNPEKSITLSSSSNGQEHGFNYGQTNILRLTVNDSGTYRFKINEINGNDYVNLRFYNKNNL